MRGRFPDQGGMFSYIQPEKRISANHPLRKVRELVREVLRELGHSFGKLYSPEGRPSIPPETECPAAASVLRHPFGADADGAT